MKFLSSLEKKTSVWFIVCASFIFFLLRLPSLFEPYWYGDEGIYQVIGFGLRHGRLLYKDIWDNKPPMLYILYALFNGDQTQVRLASLIFGLASLFIFYFLARKLFPTKTTPLIITSIFGFLLATPLIEGNVANAENFMMPIILFCAYLTIQATNSLTTKNINKNLWAKHFLLGLLLGIAFLFKVVAVFDLAAFSVFIFILSYKSLKNIIHQIITIVPIYAGFILPIVFTVIYFILKHAFSDFIHSAFLNNVGYVNYGNQFIIPQGLLIIKLLILAVVCLFLFFRRKSINKTNLFILIWTSFSIFNALFAQRPYPHYLLVLLSSLCLFLGVIANNKKQRALLIGLLLIIFIILANNFTFYEHAFGYYQNFVAFLSDKKSSESYRAFFDKATIRDYELAEFINTHAKPEDTIFLWGNNGQVYRLTNKLPISRYIVLYHITATRATIAEVGAALQKSRPRYIIVMVNEQPIPYSLVRYVARYRIRDSMIYERTL